eukprot:CAMPEP_0197864100 /NCGR_PEP_ID=MMETSP1438-20131217/42057_1 /TAXON_ID=1461541 /ORGANISM="Pterosperma sp., Strain CCMP1384" /LENGTH=54 /DNA_ID=CAMNT_0043482215 /DNA_START=105 /DNA_END=266 /DNA_ORIENTATION=+
MAAPGPVPPAARLSAVPSNPIPRLGNEEMTKVIPVPLSIAELRQMKYFGEPAGP